MCRRIACARRRRLAECLDAQGGLQCAARRIEQVEPARLFELLAEVAQQIGIESSASARLHRAGGVVTGEKACALAKRRRMKG